MSSGHFSLSPDLCTSRAGPPLLGVCPPLHRVWMGSCCGQPLPCGSFAGCSPGCLGRGVGSFSEFPSEHHDLQPLLFWCLLWRNFILMILHLYYKCCTIHVGLPPERALFRRVPLDFRAAAMVKAGPGWGRALAFGCRFC